MSPLREAPPDAVRSRPSARGEGQLRVELSRLIGLAGRSADGANSRAPHSVRRNSRAQSRTGMADPNCAAWGANIGLALTLAALAPDDQPDMPRERLPKVPVARLRSTVLVRARYWPVELPGRRGIGGARCGRT